jgi:hypothetical protein
LRHCHIAVEDNARRGPHIDELEELRKTRVALIAEGETTKVTDFDGADEFPSIPARLQCVKGSITVYAKNRKGQEVEIGDNAMRLLETHTERRCPVANMIVDSGCSMQVKWTDGGKLSTLK